MKKLLFISLVATAMLAGCSNDEMVETTQSGAIRFDGFVNKSTRGVADDITTASISNFSVYGFMTDATGQIFTGEAVTRVLIMRGLTSIPSTGLPVKSIGSRQSLLQRMRNGLML